MGYMLQIFFTFFAAIMAIVIALNVFSHHWSWWALILSILLLFFADWIMPKTTKSRKNKEECSLDPINAILSTAPLELILSILTLPVILLKKYFTSYLITLTIKGCQI